MKTKKLRVAAYCRVSTFDESQSGSFELQKQTYTEKINNNPEWEFAGIYADQDAYQEKYRNLADKYEELIVELETVEKQHLDKAKRNKEIREFLEALKVQEDLVTEFDDFLWETMVDRAIINHEKSVTISLKNKMVVII